MQRSVLQSIVAHVTLSVFLTISFLLPYIQLMLRQAYRYDRKHKISGRLIAQSIVAADSLNRQTCGLVNDVCALDEGRVGVAVKEMGVWWLQGVSGGVYEGLGEGMQVLGLRSNANADGNGVVGDGKDSGRRMAA